MGTPFTTTDLHQPPRLDVVRREQLRATGIALRNEGILFAGALALIAVLATVGTIRFFSHQGMYSSYEFGAQHALPMALVGLLLPFGAWRSEDPSRRDYHWAMPVPRETHTLMRVFAGWVWLMAAVAAYLVVLVLIGVVPPLLLGGAVHLFDGAAWEWAVPFTTASVAYLLTTALVVSSDHPWRWIGGVAAGWLLGAIVLRMFELDAVADRLDAVLTGSYGLSAAIWADVWRMEGRRVVSAPDRWAGATLIWGALGMTGVVLAARRHRSA